jgi:hypothetical protein
MDTTNGPDIATYILCKRLNIRAEWNTETPTKATALGVCIPTMVSSVSGEKNFLIGKTSCQLSSSYTEVLCLTSMLASKCSNEI